MKNNNELSIGGKGKIQFGVFNEGKLEILYEDYSNNVRDLIKRNIEDSAKDLLYYNRKEDEDLPLGLIEQCIKDDIISIDYIVDVYKNALIENINET